MATALANQACLAAPVTTATYQTKKTNLSLNRAFFGKGVGFTVSPQKTQAARELTVRAGAEKV